MTESDQEPLLLPDDLPDGHRSGFVAIVGRPNVGKSTLLNYLLGQKIAIVSPLPQTTRNRLLGILTQPMYQIVFVDTPGIHAPLHKLGALMVDDATQAIPGADAVVWVVESIVHPTGEDRKVAELLARLPAGVPVILTINKSELVSADDLARKIQEYLLLLPTSIPVPISAATGAGVDALLDTLVARLPEGPRYYPEEQVTDQQERFVAAELVREQVLLLLRQEVPHSVAVVVEEFKDRTPDLTYISAVVYVERASQKGIVLGKDGAMLKRIGQGARASIQEMLGHKVFLDLWVKVRPDWRSRDTDLNWLGFQSRQD
jgi:GTPase